MKFLHYTLHPRSPIVKIYKAFQHADIVSVSTATYKQLTYCDPLCTFKILSAQDVTQPYGSAILFRPEIYTLIHFIPSVCSVTLVLQDRDTQLLFAVTTVSLPECADTALNLLAMILRDAQDYIGQMPHIIAGDFQLPRAFNKNRGMLMSLGYHDLLGQISPGPTRFRRGYLPDVADYVFYRGPVAAMECLVRPLKRPDIDHEGSDHSPIYVFFFLGHITTVDY